MKKKIMLTSVLAIGFAYPAIAETFPSNGVMLENATYENAATYSNMGVYDGTVTATAEYENVLYQIGAGQYLPAASEVVTTCPAGNYCSGMSDALYSETESQGLTACPTTYPNSDEGASVDTHCYTACTLEGANIPHATAVDGNDYFGTGTDTCGATACENGYHVREGGAWVEKEPLIPVDYQENSDGQVYRDKAGSYSGSSGNGYVYDSLTENNTWGAHFSNGIVYGRASCQQYAHANNEILSYVLDESGSVIYGGKALDEFESGLAAISNSVIAKSVSQMLEQVKNGDKNKEMFDQSMYVLFVTEKDAEYSTTSSGDYCYCQMTRFVSNDGAIQVVDTAPWVFVPGRGPGPGCEYDCALRCAGFMFNNNIQAAMFDSIDISYGSICEANTINITWSDADQADIDANNAGVCEYDGDIRTPVKAIKKPGKTFKGWKFQK